MSLEILIFQSFNHFSEPSSRLGKMFGRDSGTEETKNSRYVKIRIVMARKIFYLNGVWRQTPLQTSIAITATTLYLKVMTS